MPNKGKSASRNQDYTTCLLVLGLFFVSINLLYDLAWNTVSYLPGAPNYYLGRSANFQKRVCGTVVPTLADSLEHLVKVTMWSAEFFSIAITLVMFIWTEWTEWIPLPHARSRSTPFSDRLYHFHVTISRCCKDLSTVSFLAQLDSGYLCLQNAFHELNGFSPRVNEHILFLALSEQLTLLLFIFFALWSPFSLAWIETQLRKKKHWKTKPCN